MDIHGYLLSAKSGSMSTNILRGKHVCDSSIHIIIQMHLSMWQVLFYVVIPVGHIGFDPSFL